MKTNAKIAAGAALFLLLLVSSFFYLGKASEKEEFVKPLKSDKTSSIKDTLRKEWQKFEYWVDKTDRETDWIDE